MVVFRELLRDLSTYHYNVKKMVDSYGADPTCVDGARFYWRCKEIISVNSEGHFQDVLLPPDNFYDNSDLVTSGKRFKPPFERKIPSPQVCAILRGGVRNGERNSTCFRVGLELGSMGYSEEEVARMIICAGIDVVSRKIRASDFDYAEMKKAIAQGIKYAQERD